ncbi:MULTISPECIES: P-type conjugative transfer protein TrbL [unclassified Bartonella]|uniref:P-type conjugative transfer protein TrbL n=1 Tax=unclassified Bartonella TaxID=2645622 RepID=UPI0035CEF986
MLGYIFFTDISFANGLDKTKEFNGLLDLIQNQSHRWYSKLHYYGFRLFWLLATLQFILSFIPLLFKQSDIADFVGELVKFILVIGFFAALLEYSQEWGTAIVESFRTAAADASGRGRNLFPSDILGEASDIMEAMANVSTWNPITSVLIAIQSVIVFLCFGFIAVLLAVTLIESYIIINASVIFMGFGASQWTREISITTFRYTVSVGAKLFVMTLLVTLISDSMKAWKDAYVYSSASNWTLLGLSLLCVYLTKTIPEIIAGLISGTSGGSGATIGAMAGAAIGAVVVAATAAAGAPAVAAGGTGGALGGASGGMGGGGAATGVGSNTNASQLTGNSFKDSGNKPTSGGNPRVAGGESRSTSTSKSQSKSVTSDQSKSAASDESNSALPKMRDATDMTLKGLGHMAAFCVPGMENAANLSLNAPPTPPEYNDIQFFSDNKPQSDIENTISGAGFIIDKN